MSKNKIFRKRHGAEERIGRGLCTPAVLIGAIGLAAAAIVSPAKAEGQVRCAPRADVVTALTGKFKEAATGMGLASDGTVVEVFSARDGASWTIVVTLANGLSCPILDGHGWEKLPFKVAGRAS